MNLHISKNTPILFITALYSKDEGDQIFRNYPVLNKPFSLQALLDKVSDLIDKFPLQVNELELTFDEKLFKSNFLYWMEVLYSQPNVIDQLVEKLNLSKYDIEIRVLNLMHMNLRAYVLNYRVKKSIELINKGHLNITEIANKCGFVSAKTFTEVFKKFIGLTPKKFILKNT